MSVKSMPNGVRNNLIARAHERDGAGIFKGFRGFAQGLNIVAFGEERLQAAIEIWRERAPPKKTAQASNRISIPRPPAQECTLYGIPPGP